MTDQAKPEMVIVGTRQRRFNGREMVTGRGILHLATDLVLPGMLYARVLGSRYAHAEVVSIDTSKAKALPGVKAVLTGKDVAGYPNTDGNFQVITEEALMVHDFIAAVAATSEEIAREAVDLLEVTYNVLPQVVELVEALKPGAVRIHPQDSIDERELVLGDIDQGFQEADVIIDGAAEGDIGQRFYYPALPERTSAVAQWSDSNTRLTVWPTTQSVSQAQQKTADFFGLPHSDVRVITKVVGCGFGNRMYSRHNVRVTCLAALLAREAGQPVRLTEDMEQCFNGINARVAVYYDQFEMGCKSDGTITALRAHSNSDGGAYGQNRYSASLNFDWRRSLVWPNFHYTYTGRYTNRTAGATMRGVGNTPSHLAVLTTCDRMAEELGMNPLDFWLKNALQDHDILGSIGIPVASCALTECLEKAAVKTDYRAKWHPPGGRTLPDGRKHGIAIVPFTHACGVPSDGTNNATVTVYADGSIRGFVGCQDQGQYTKEAMSIILAEEFKISSLDRCRVQIGDTDSCPYGPSSSGSKVTNCGGTAIIWAARDLKKKLFEVAAPMLEVDATALATKEHEIYEIANPTNKATLAAVVASWGRRGRAQLIGVGHPKWKEEERVIEFGAMVFEVAVDTETGHVECTDYTVFIDLGRAINKLSVENQFHSGAAEGLGSVLMEGVVIDKESGYTLNANLLDYKCTSTLDIPYPIYVEPVEPVDRVGPHGAKGIGEACVNAVAPGILNAIYNAIGVRINHNTFTCYDVLKALGKG